LLLGIMNRHEMGNSAMETADQHRIHRSLRAVLPLAGQPDRSLKPIEPLGVGFQDLVDGAFGNAAFTAQALHGADVGGGVVVAVIGADE